MLAGPALRQREEPKRFSWTPFRQRFRGLRVRHGLQTHYERDDDSANCYSLPRPQHVKSGGSIQNFGRYENTPPLTSDRSSSGG